MASKKKKRINSKHKGNSFEGQVAKKLSEALAPLNFRRVQSSGAIVGGQNFETIGKMFGTEALRFVCGDITPLNEKEAGVVFKHSIETKFYKTPDSFPALVSGNANVFAWMKEAEDDAVKINRNPLLIFKWNNTSVFCASHPTPDSPSPKLTLVKDNSFINIFYLADLLVLPNFWYDTIILKSIDNRILT